MRLDTIRLVVGGAVGPGIRTAATDEVNPGGWVYAILEHVEEEAIRRFGADAPSEAEKRLAASRAMATVIPTINCPTRRRAQLYPMPWPYTPANSESPSGVARSDYAMNAGDVGVSTLGFF